MRRSEIKKPIEVTTVLRKNAILPLVASIPHSATFIPTEIRRSFLISDNELEQEFLVLTADVHP